MHKDLIIFGIGEQSELAYYYFSKGGEYNVLGFTVNGSYINDPLFCGLPVFPYETLSSEFPPSKFSMHVAIGYEVI